MNTSDDNSFNFIEYINDNFVGLILLISVVFIIYFVDYINRINALIYSTSSSIPIFNSVVGSPQLNLKRKIKKR